MAGEHPGGRHFVAWIFKLCVTREETDYVEAATALAGGRCQSSPVEGGPRPYKRLSAFGRELREVTQMDFMSSQLKSSRTAQRQVLANEGHHHGDTSGHGRSEP